MVKEFSEFFESVFLSSEAKTQSNYKLRTTKKFVFDADKCLSPIKIKTSLDNLEPRKAGGPDGVHSYMLKECSESLAKP